LLLLVARWWRGVSHPQNQAACVFFSGVGDSLGHVLLEYNQLPRLTQQAVVPAVVAGVAGASYISRDGALSLPIEDRQHVVSSFRGVCFGNLGADA
jgi:hypothetical protein